MQAIRAGKVLIADRVLLKGISWNDIQEALSGKEPEVVLTASETIASALESSGYHVLLRGEMDIIAANPAGDVFNISISRAN